MSSANISGKLANHWQQHWLLDRQITFLNHGSFGACPQVVLAEQQRLRSQLELDPVRFFMEDFEPLLDRARDQLAHFVGANPQNLVFVPNATTGVNTVLRSLHFHPGDEILTTDHTYNACQNALNVVGERQNIQIVRVPVPFPLESPDQIIEAVMQKVSSKTKLVLLDHATSQTGLIFPLQKLISQLTKVFASIVTAPPGPKPTELLPQVQCPLLVLWGEDDPWTPVSGGRIFQDFARCCSATLTRSQPIKFVSIPKTGHCPHDERPDVVNPLILEWLQNL